MKSPFTAIGAVKSDPFKRPGIYPAVPATWPNRAIRRAVRYSKKLPAEWAAFFTARPELKAFVTQAYR